VATDPETIEDPNAAAPEGEEQQSNGDDSPYADLAKDMGWTPRDKFEGPADQWKDAETFIRDGRDIQRETSRELKGVRAQLETIARTSASVVEQQVKDRVEALTVQYNKAVEDGDSTTAFKLTDDIRTTLAAAKPQTSGPSPEAAAFAERNASWFQKPGNEYATARAVEICNTLAAQGYSDHGQQLKIAEQRLRQEMPQLFAEQKNGKPAPGVNAPGSRTASPGSKAKGYANLPPEARKIADDMESRGVIKANGDVSAKEIYARNYFANLEGKS
jgi:hypothetical protein